MSSRPPPIGPDDTPPITLDEVAGRLLDARFDVREGSAGPLLFGERELGDGARRLLGRATPFVGRDRELWMLEALFDACVEEGSAVSALVTAPAGVGKSRLAYEFVRAVQARAAPTTIWTGRGDPRRAGSAFGVLGQAIRGALGLSDGEPLAARRDKLHRRLEGRLEPAKLRYVAAFLGELAGAPLPDDAHPLLVAARKDAQLMNDHLRQAFRDFTAAACEGRPLILLLEDLHWGDLPTVQFIDRALRDLRDRPLFVLALARPDVHDKFPRLWAERNVQEIRLKLMNARASERLARHVLGEDADPALIARLVSLSEGNAFYLEELIRAAAEGNGSHLPETLVAMVQSRLGALDERARHVLRAGSVFGEVFWEGGVAALLGGPDQGARASELLSELAEKELVFRRRKSRFSGEAEYAFRHALLREGAYAMLTPKDRSLGHRLAGEWLEGAGEQDPLVLAEHSEVGGEGGRAARFYLRAATLASRGGDAAATMSHARRGLANAPPDDLRAALLGQLCEAHYFHRDNLRAALPHAEELGRLAERGSAAWVQGMFIRLLCAAEARDPLSFIEALAALRSTEPAPSAELPMALALSTAVYLLDLNGYTREGDVTMDRIVEIARAAADRDPGASGVWHTIAGARDAYARSDPASALVHCEAAIALGRAVGHSRLVAFAQTHMAMNFWFLGARDEAERALDALTLPDEELGHVTAPRRVSRAWLFAERGDIESARIEAGKLIDYGRSRGLPNDEGEGRWVLAEVLRREGDLAGAEREIESALALFGDTILLDRPAALATLAAIRLKQARPEEALAAAEEALAIIQKTRACAFFRGAFARITRIECLTVAGERSALREAITEAAGYVLSVAEKISDPSRRASFLAEVPENVAILRLVNR